jgi:fused signal recognition particle receptor
MALGFIKKIFSFGKEEGAASKPATPDVVPAFPGESAPVFTPETDLEIEVATPEPLETEHAAEPALGESEVHHHDQTVDGDLDAEGGDAGETDLAMAESSFDNDMIAPPAARATDHPIEVDLPEVRETVKQERPSLPAGFTSASDRKPEPEPISEPQKKVSWIERLRRGLARTSAQLTQQIASLFTKRKLDDDTLQDLEDLLIQADLGVETAMRISGALSSERYGKDVTGEDVARIMAGEITKVLTPVAKPLELDLSHKPHVILVVGVNGTGKTTTIGKLSAKLSRAGLKVMLAAGDTFRAAAIEQLHIWADRTGAEIVSTKLGADSASLAYEAYEKARASGHDVLIIDTAGRLQNKTELMAELEKIVRVLGKLDPDAPHTVLQTLDATTGQNAMNQVEIFRNIAGVSGLIMTKLDGTARGGILVAISAKHRLPVYFIGVGEGVDDLEPFDAKDFADAIAGIGMSNK